MKDQERNTRLRAWIFAHKILSVVKTVHDGENADMLSVSTEEICAAMGEKDGANLDDVRKFVCRVIEYLRGYSVNVVCGCGQLSMKVMLKERLEELSKSTRDITFFEPKNFEEYFSRNVLNRDAGDTEINETCETNGIVDKLKEI